MKHADLLVLFLLFGCSNSPTTAQSDDNRNMTAPVTEAPTPMSRLYQPRGIGGGGAMAGYSISPYSPLRFVGTDMGTLFRSVNNGLSWQAISHDETRFDSDLSRAAYIGFSSNPNLVFHASGGTRPQRSIDSGITWQTMKMPLLGDERVKYWISDRLHANTLFAATTSGILRTQDSGVTWTRASGLQGDSVGTFFQNTDAHPVIYHATTQAIFVSEDLGNTFRTWFTPSNTGIRSFAGGKDSNGLTLTFIDTDGASACAWATQAADSSGAEKYRTQADCGYVWVKRSGAPLDPSFNATTKEAGRFVRMAENNSRTMYVTGGDWVRQYGTKVWVSSDAGVSWDLKLQVYNWDQTPYAPWPRDRLEYSAVGLDVGWDDNAYSSFSVNPLNASEAGGTGYYFLHTTQDSGATWKAPFTHFADNGDRARGERWKSTGLEVTSVMRLKFHPSNPKLGYASLSDMGGLVTEDGGESWRVSKAQYNTNYDYAFDPALSEVVYAASGSVHDYPLGDYKNVSLFNGGIFRSTDRGHTWKRLTPDSAQWNHQFLSVGYDSIHKVLYGGCMGCGIARSRDGGASWDALNDGLPTGDLTISQIEIDPVNGAAYALVAADSPKFSNRSQTGIYFLDPTASAPKWQLLRGEVRYPPEADKGYELWWSPTAFAVDWSNPGRQTLWLADYEVKGSWLASGIWKSTDRGAHWDRKVQFTHPTQLTLDPQDPNTIYASGLYQADGGWGQGGAMSSTDGGAHWKKNMSVTLTDNLFGAQLDPNHPDQIFYLFFGGGMLYGPKPR